MSGAILDPTHAASGINPTGTINGFPVGSFIQIIELEQKTCTLQVRANGKKGCLYIKKGVVLDAETEAYRGEEAALIILGWDDAQIKLVDACEKKKNDIRSSLTRLIIEASRLKDEVNDANASNDPLAQAIHLIEGNHFKKGHARIVAFLKTHPKSCKAWLWYSRCLGNLQSISVVLNKCKQICPKNRQLVEEIGILKQAYKHVKDERLRRCPFCWSPLDQRVQQCYYCKSRLFISDALKQNTLKQVKSKYLIDAVTRYTYVVAHENNVKAVYYLSLANCNLDKAEEALDLLNEASRINPDNKFLSDQLNIVINHVATRLNKYEGSATKQAKKTTHIKPAVDISRKKILIVEDSPTTRKVVVLTLKQKGYALVEARDGLEALSKIDEERPDLVLLDIILPKMDGYRILSIIKKSPELRDTPVILLTSKDGLLNKVKGRLAGSTAYLTKPFKPKELIETVRKHIG